MAFDSMEPHREESALESLIGILESVDDERYDQDKYHDERDCGVVACALGWFALAAENKRGVEMRVSEFKGVTFLLNGENSCPSEIAERVFGVPGEAFGPSYGPWTQRFYEGDVSRRGVINRLQRIADARARAVHASA